MREFNPFEIHRPETLHGIYPLPLPWETFPPLLCQLVWGLKGWEQLFNERIYHACLKEKYDAGN